MFSTDKPLSLSYYLIGIAVIFIAVYVPYFVDVGSQVVGYLIVYGIPIAVVSVLFGKQILSRAAKNNKEALKVTLGTFSPFYIAGIFTAAIALAIILQFYPSATDLLQKTNPVLNVSPTEAWVFVAFSLLVVGPAEEYLFRGFMYGGLLNLTKGKYWLPLAIISSLMFAAAHGYYAQTYGVASPVFYIELVMFGVSMAVAYNWSGGNLLALAVVHGTNDAIGFLSVATTASIAGVNVSRIAQIVFIAVGFVFTVTYVLKKKVLINPTPTPEQQPQTRAATSTPPPPAQ